MIRLRFPLPTFFVLTVKTLFLFTSGVFLAGDFLIRVAIMQTQVWATDVLWPLETWLIFGLGLVCFAWFLFSLMNLTEKLHQEVKKNEEN
jgi:hypothetical protein